MKINLEGRAPHKKLYSDVFAWCQSTGSLPLESEMDELISIVQNSFSLNKNQTHVTIGYFIYTVSDNDDTQVYETYQEMFEDWPNKDRLMVREIVSHIAADNIYITPPYIVNKAVDDVSDDCGVNFKYEASR